jgi:hypothetical protein
MARTSIFKRVGAGAISGTIALLSCNNALRNHDEPEPTPRLHPIPRSAPCSAPIKTPSEVAGAISTTATCHGKKASGRFRRAVALRQKVKTLSSRAALLPKRSARRSPQPKLLRTTAAISIFDALKSQSPDSLDTTTNTSGSVSENSGDLTAEDTDEVLIEGTPIIVPESIPSKFNAIPFPRIDTVVSGFADSFLSEILNSIILGADNVVAVPDAYEHVEVCSPPIAVGTVPTAPSVTTTALIPVRRIATQVSTIARSTSFTFPPLATTINSGLLFALLAERSVILPSLPVLDIAWTEASSMSFVAGHDNLTISLPATSFVYSPRPSITYEAALPTPFAGEQTNVLQSGFVVEEVGETDETTSDGDSHLAFEESSSPVLVDSATQTDNVDNELVPLEAATHDLPAETESQQCSSSEQSLLESEGSDTPATSRSGHSEGPPEFTREEEAAHYQEHIEHLESVVRCLRREAEDHDAEKEALNSTVNRLQREKEEVESDAENLRSQLSRKEERDIAETIEVYERIRRETVQAIEDYYQIPSMVALGRMMRMEETLSRMEDTLRTHEEALRIHEDNDTGNIVLNILNSLQADQHQNRGLLVQLREGEEVIRNLTRETEQSRQMMPLIERQVRELIQERNDLAHQLGQYQSQHQHNQTQVQGGNH